jgi:hypothetical protein
MGPNQVYISCPGSDLPYDCSCPGREKFLLQKESVLVNIRPYDSTDLDENA